MPEFNKVREEVMLGCYPAPPGFERYAPTEEPTEEDWEEMQAAHDKMDAENEYDEAREAARKIMSQEARSRSALRQLMSDYEKYGPGTRDNI